MKIFSYTSILLYSLLVFSISFGNNKTQVPLKLVKKSILSKPKKALLLLPFQYEFKENISKIERYFNNAGYKTEVYKNSNADLDKFRGSFLTNFDIVYISTHGHSSVELNKTNGDKAPQIVIGVNPNGNDREIYNSLTLEEKRTTGRVGENPSTNQDNKEDEKEDENIQFRAVGNSAKPKLGMENTSELTKSLFTDLRKGTGATVISSAGGMEFAMESDQWKNGLFTYCMLMGIKSGKADKNKDGEIWLSELKEYISEKVIELSNGKQQPTSRIENQSVDFRVW